MMISAPFTGDRSKVKQIDPGKFQDTATGNYYTGTWDNATNWGTDYNQIGKEQAVSPPTTTAQPSTLPPDTQSRTSDPYGGLPTAPNTNLYGGPSTPTSPYQLPTGLPGGAKGNNIPLPDNTTNWSYSPTGAIVWNGGSPMTPQQMIDYTRGQVTSQSGGTSPTTTTGALTNNPTGWNNENNAPYGVTLAGWSPGDHTNLTAQDLRDPQNAKYAFYQFLTNNQFPADLGAGFSAPSLAKNLNDLYYGGQQIFTAIDGETLQLPDGQYVHPAPNGWGMQPGTYNPNASATEWYWSNAPDGGASPAGGGGATGPIGNMATAAKTLPGYAALSPSQTGTADEAVTYLNGISHSLGGADLSQAELAQYASMVGYKEGQPVTGDMVNKIVSAMMQAKGYAAPGGSSAPPPTTGATTPPPGGTYTPTTPFDDPATKNYIDLLNQRIQSLLQPRQDPSLDAFIKQIQDRVTGLQTPYTNPDAGPLQDWMRQYFAQLQQPTYTPAQQDLLKTQALEPMEQQRQAELKNVATTMASRGITPGSGPYLQAERDINQKYDALRAQTQSGLAVNEINQGRQDQASAANVGGQLAQFTQGQFANNEQRANDAVSLFGTIPQLNLAEFQNQDQRANSAVTLAKQIPDMAQQRIAQATQLLSGSNINPAQLLTSLQQFQQQGIGQNTADSQFWSQLFAAIAKNFGL